MTIAKTEESPVDEYYRHAKKTLFPKMKSSDMSIAIIGSDPDPKLCMEIGAAVMFDKPIILIVRDYATKVPANLKRVASAIIYGEHSNPDTQRRLEGAITALIENDIRIKKPANA